MINSKVWLSSFSNSQHRTNAKHLETVSAQSQCLVAQLFETGKLFRTRYYYVVCFFFFSVGHRLSKLSSSKTIFFRLKNAPIQSDFQTNSSVTLVRVQFISIIISVSNLQRKSINYPKNQHKLFDCVQRIFFFFFNFDQRKNVMIYGLINCQINFEYFIFGRFFSLIRMSFGHARKLC